MAAIYTCDRCGEVKKQDELDMVDISFNEKDYNSAYQIGLKGRVSGQMQRFQACVNCRVEVKEQFRFSKVDDYNIQAKS